MTQYGFVNNLLASRRRIADMGIIPLSNGNEAEGGCGVIGIACSEKIRGFHLLQSLKQMKNRGNGKGGGIAAVGLIPEELGVSREILERDYLLPVAYLDSGSRQEVERKHIEPIFDIDYIRAVPGTSDYRAAGLGASRPTAPKGVKYKGVFRYQDWQLLIEIRHPRLSQWVDGKGRSREESR